MLVHKSLFILLLFVFLGCGEDPQPTSPELVVATEKISFSNESEVSGSSKNVLAGIVNNLFTVQVFVSGLSSPTMYVANRNLQIVFNTSTPNISEPLSGQPGDCKVSIQLFKGTEGEFDLLTGSVTMQSLPTSNGQVFLIDLDLDFFGSSLKGTVTASFGSIDPLYPLTPDAQAVLCN